MADDRNHELPDDVFDEVKTDRIQEVELKKTMESSYIDYAMSVIAQRALPDVRDGLKPVQRRILYSMIELNNGPDKPHRKCARIVGDTMGKFHPHGDTSIYGALVNMAQPWSMRYCLVDGHGNFGSVDGDGAAAMRYTEARMSKISMEMTADIDKDTVDFVPNFDETEKEPTVMPSRFPNLLVNGTTGIAVGMATNIPPHNLREVVGAVVKMIDNRVEEDRETEIDEILEIVKAPDFPTGGMILGVRGAEEAYRTGRGKVIVRAITNVETDSRGKNTIVVSELPYLVNKANLIAKIAELVKDKRLEGITGLRDSSDREGMRIEIELRKDINPQVMLNKLFKHTQMQDSFGINMLALVHNEPKVMSLKDVLMHYITHQENVVTRRTRYDLNKAEERDHILQGLLIALDNIDEVIQIVRGSKTVPIAKEQLKVRFGLSDAQAQAIVDMRLRTLTGLERDKIEQEHQELLKKIAELKAILADRKKLLGVIRTEILTIAEKFGDERRSRIEYDSAEIDIEDLIPNTQTVIAMTSLGYIKRMSMDNFHAQGRGGRGIKGISTIENDYVEDLFITRAHRTLLFFTNYGSVYRLKAYQIPEASRTARGVAIVNLLQLSAEEKITATISLSGNEEDKNLFMATKYGVVKKTPVREFQNIRNNGLNAIALKDNDELIEVKETDGENDIFMVTKFGMSIHFKESDVRPLSRAAMGVRGMMLTDEDEVIGMQINTQGSTLLVVSEKGYGKRTELSEFTLQKRGGKGLKCYKITEKTGNVIGVKAVENEHDLMMITNAGTMIQIHINEISVFSRITSGVKLINLDENVLVAKIAKVRNNPDEESEEGNDQTTEQEEESEPEKES